MRLILPLLIAGSLAVSSLNAATPVSCPAPQQPEAEKKAEDIRSDVPFPTGLWRAWFWAKEGNQLHFTFEVEQTDRGYRAFLVNGDERIQVGRTQWNKHKGAPGVLRLAFPHYDSVIRGVMDPNMQSVKGKFFIRRGDEPVRRMDFMARHGEGPRFPKLMLPGGPRDVAGRWEMKFADSETPAVMILQQADLQTKVTGTVLTSTGDYRFLEGSCEKGYLRLSVFDGAHAFLFTGRIDKEGKLNGDFYSGTWYSTKFVASRQASAVLPDPLEETRWHEGVQLADLAFPNLKGETMSFVDRRWAGRPTILNLFGTWCPNCHDEAELLGSLYTDYGRQGLLIVGMAFEFPGEAQRSIDQVSRFRLRHQTQYATVLAGNTPKSASTRAVGAIDRLRSYPTSIFVRRDGSIAGVHTGFIGPAAGEEHVAERERFETLTKAILESDPFDHGVAATAFGKAAWSQGGNRLELKDGPIVESRADGTSTSYPLAEGSNDEALAGATFVPGGLWLGDVLWRLDLAHGLAWQSTDPDHRLGQEDRTMLLAEVAASKDATARIACLVQSTLEGAERLSDEALIALLADEVPVVQIYAAWVAGFERRASAKEALAKLGDDPHPPLAREVDRALGRLID